MALQDSGSSTPLSSTETLSPPGSPQINKSGNAIHSTLFNNPRTQASTLIEYISSRPENSSFVYVYDVAEQVGFGTLTKEWARTTADTAKVVDLQTRAGAGLSLVGRLSQGTSLDAVKGTILTAYTTPTGLAQMAPSFPYLPPASSTTRLIVQVPSVTPVGDTLSLSPTLAPLASVWSILPESVAILLSSTPQQTADFASLSYKITDSHIVHLFDHHSTSREVGHAIAPLRSVTEATNLQTAVRQAGYEFFEYHGDKTATSVVVLLNGPLALTLKAAVNSKDSGLGVVIVNVFRPWDEAAIQAAIPLSATAVHVLDDVPNAVTQGSLYVDVFSALWNVVPKRAVTAHRITPAQTQAFATSGSAFFDFIAAKSHIDLSKSMTSAKKVLLFGIPRTPLAAFPTFLEELFLKTQGILSRLLTDHDVFSKPGGISASRLLISRNNASDLVPIPVALPLDADANSGSDFLGIFDQSLLKTYSLLKHAKTGSTVVIVTSWTNDELIATISQEVTSLIVERNLSVYIIDARGIASNIVGAQGPIHDAVQNLLLELVFLRLYLGPSASEGAVFELARASFDDTIEGIPLSKFNAHAWSSLQAVVIPPADAATFDVPLLKDFEFNAIAVEVAEGKTVVNGARLSSWHDAAKHLLFPSIFMPSPDEISEQGNPALRPEIPETTFLVTCTVNKRLTPLEYDRNVFHLEFDTSGTGLKYAIGEALGVYGWNDEQEVNEFCEWYGVDPHRLVTIPVATDETKMHTRTVMQALQQQIDLFGRPPKSFYTDLAEYATNDVDRYALCFIGSPEGSATFKKMAEKDTVTFADVLKKYSSARPGIERLCEMVGDIKPRHYSIASAQSVVGDRVDLLVVTVDWQTPSGLPRHGQCTRYLAGLKVGQKVTVSIKPSVMKLPPNPKQPIIMAGLGTGAAPFRAFLQHLALQVSQGVEIGPVYYYFGSRYQAAEYLYGEEIEAFLLDGLITRAGLAFSRDSKQKVYIQHKMLEDSEALAQMMHDDKGVFYLCGPTWPVPDVYEALVNALVKYKGSDPVEAGEYLESLKEEERYVLEVY